MSTIKDGIKNVFYKGSPEAVRRRFTRIPEAELPGFRKLLFDTYYSSYQVFDDKSDFKKDIENQLESRLHKFRHQVVPWINNSLPLEGSRILEIGCGTGSSTVAFAEQGARVTALDVEENSLKVAKKRVHLHGLDAEFVLGNGEDAGRLFSGREFDAIVFPATLEHMTYEERINSLRSVASLLRKGNALIVVETPNRLWFRDFHTAYLPFYFWLPDELAFDYAKFSTRRNFKELYTERTPEKMQHFIRRGRGVSFHDFQIALQDHPDIRLVSSLEHFRKRAGTRFIADRLKSRSYLTFRKFLIKNGPQLHPGYYEPWLDLIFVRE